MTKLLLLLFLCSAVASAENVKAVITVDRDVYQDVLQFLDGRNVQQVEHFNSPLARRDVVDFVLIQQAIALGGVTLNVRFEPGNYDARNIRSVVSGILLVSLDSFWRSELDKVANDIYISEPLIRRGEYFAGLYTAPDNHKALLVRSVEQLRKLSVISNSDWSADWHTLQQFDLPYLINEKSWSSQAKLVSRGWVDFMLAPFLPGNDFRFRGDGYEIMAVPGVKVLLDDSRHVAVSRKHPAGEQVFNALQRGLAIMRQQGRIQRAYEEAGFFNAHVKDWQILKAPARPAASGQTETAAAAALVDQ